MSFKIKNIIEEPRSTVIGLSIAAVVFYLVHAGKADFASASPVLLVVIPFLLYGNDKNQNAKNDFNRSTPPQMFLVATMLLMGCKQYQVIRELEIVRDTIVIKGETVERNFYYNQKDTVFIKGDKITMKYYYHTYDSTVYLQGHCEAETIFFERIVPLEQVVVDSEEEPDYKAILKYLLLAALIVITIFLFFRPKNQ